MFRNTYGYTHTLNIFDTLDLLDTLEILNILRSQKQNLTPDRSNWTLEILVHTGTPGIMNTDLIKVQ